MNRALRRISIAVLVMFVVLLINVNYLQGFDTASLANEPNNARAFEAQFQYQRGNIVTSGRRDGRRVQAERRRLQVQALLPLGPGVRACDRLRHPVQPDRYRGGGELAAVRQ